MIDRHAVQALVQSGLSTQEIAKQMGISTRSVQRIAKERPIAGVAWLREHAEQYGSQ